MALPLLQCNIPKAGEEGKRLKSTRSLHLGHKCPLGKRESWMKGEGVSVNRRKDSSQKKKGKSSQCITKKKKRDTL